jgi:hypothetical protein
MTRMLLSKIAISNYTVVPHVLIDSSRLCLSLTIKNSYSTVQCVHAHISHLKMSLEKNEKGILMSLKLPTSHPTTPHLLEVMAVGKISKLEFKF